MRLARLILSSWIVWAAACGGHDTVTVTDPPPPALSCVPSLQSPQTGAVVDNGCSGFADFKTWEFSWSACPNVESYHLLVQQAAASRAVIDDPSLTSTTFRQEGRSYVLNDNRLDWRWRVRSRQQGVWGDWTPERTFNVEPLDTDCPQGPTAPLPLQLSPSDGSVFSHFPRTVTLVWASAAGAVRYGVEVDCFHCCGPNGWCTDVGRTWFVDAGVSGNSYSFEFPGAQAGRWRVWAIDAGGNPGPRTGWWEFRFTV